MSYHNILITRPEREAIETKNAINYIYNNKLNCIINPVLEEKLINFSYPDIKYEGIIFTSQRAVRNFSCKAENSKFKHKVVFAVGEKTALEASVNGYSNIIQGHGSIKDLLKTISNYQKFNINNCNKSVYLYPCSAHISDDSNKLLTTEDFDVDKLPVYDMKIKSDLSVDLINFLNSGKRMSAVMFYSSRTAKSFCDIMTSYEIMDKFTDSSAFCISKKVADTLVCFDRRKILISKRPDNESMLELLSKIV